MIHGAKMGIDAAKALLVSLFATAETIRNM